MMMEVNKVAMTNPPINRPLPAPGESVIPQSLQALVTVIGIP